MVRTANAASAMTHTLRQYRNWFCIAVVVCVLTLMAAPALKLARQRVASAASNKSLLLHIGGKTYVLRARGSGNNPQPVDSQLQPVDDRQQWALDLLSGLGNTQPDYNTMAFVVAWTKAEDRSSGAFERYNPLNTTQTGFGETVTINGDGVKGYPDYDSGMAATLTTLVNGRYDEIVAGLQSNDPQRVLAGLYASPWGTHADVVASIFQEELNSIVVVAPVNAPAPFSGGKHPVTDTGIVSSNFYDIGSGAWSRQYGGMHLGTDFAGNPGNPDDPDDLGDNVYAPFDMIFDQIGFYSDSGRYGYYVIGYFDDGTLFYAGHLANVPQFTPGQRITAGTVIGHIGNLMHTHIKLSPVGAPQPCEPSGTCIDFEDYYNEH